MNIKEQLIAIRSSIPEHVKIVAVSKTHPVSTILEAYHAGQRIFGENKVQELIKKQPYFPDDIQWHFIGHLQSNKVKYIAHFITCIESVDSLKLLKEINRQAMNNGRIINCMLQFHIASESAKFGMNFLEASELLKSMEFSEMKNVLITGVMGMATFTEDIELIRKEFRLLMEIFLRLKKAFFKNDPLFKEISMGMSGDYEIAIEEGSTMVRIGSAIFGERIIN